MTTKEKCAECGGSGRDVYDGHVEPCRVCGGPAPNKFASGQQFEAVEYFRAESAAWVAFASAFGARAGRWFPAHSPDGEQAAAEYADRMVALMRERL